MRLEKSNTAISSCWCRWESVMSWSGLSFVHTPWWAFSTSSLWVGLELKAQPRHLCYQPLEYLRFHCGNVNLVILLHDLDLAVEVDEFLSTWKCIWLSVFWWKSWHLRSWRRLHTFQFPESLLRDCRVFLIVRQLELESWSCLPLLGVTRLTSWGGLTGGYRQSRRSFTRSTSSGPRNWHIT